MWLEATPHRLPGPPRPQPSTRSMLTCSPFSLQPRSPYPHGGCGDHLRADAQVCSGDSRPGGWSASCWPPRPPPHPRLLASRLGGNQGLRLPVPEMPPEPAVRAGPRLQATALGLSPEALPSGQPLPFLSGNSTAISNQQTSLFFLVQTPPNPLPVILLRLLCRGPRGVAGPQASSMHRSVPIFLPAERCVRVAFPPTL